MTFTTTDTDPYTKEISIAFVIPKKDFIYKDFITCSVDNPTIILSPWKANKQTVAYYDSSFKESKQVFNEDFTITIIVTASSYAKASPFVKTSEDRSADRPSLISNPAHLYCTYYRRSEKKINHALFPLVFTAKPQDIQEHIDITTEVIEYNELPLKIKKKTNLLDDYVLSAFSITHTVIASVRIDHKKYFALLIFLIIVLISFCYFFRKELKTQVKIKELIEIIISLLVVTSFIYLLLYVHKISSPLMSVPFATIVTLCTGLFYIKKSTQLQSARLRTFCTFIGMFCICSALLFAFKTLQYADEQFKLF